MKRCLLVFFIFVGFIVLPIFFIKFGKVECVGTHGTSCSPEVRSLVYNFAGESFFDIYSKTGELSSLPFVLNYNLRFFPLKREVVLEVREREILIGVEAHNGYVFLVDRGGNLIKETRQPVGVTVVRVEGFDYKVPDRVHGDLLSSFQAISYLCSFYGLEEGVIFDDRIEVRVKNGPLLVLPRGKDYRTVLGEARFLIDSLFANPQEFQLDKSVTYITIDLRYRNPILR